MTTPETIYFAKHGQSLVPLDDDDRAWLNRHGAGELIAFDRPKVKNRDAKTHRRFFLMTRIAFQNQPEPEICATLGERGIKYYDTENQFRYGWTAECGHVDVWEDIHGEVHVKPKSLRYDETTEDELIELAKRVSAAWRRIYGPAWTEGVIDEVSRLTGGGNW